MIATAMFTSDHRAHWEELARKNPFHAVLTQAEFESTDLDERKRAEFYESGVRHFDRILSLLPALRIRSALDFGCGVGRVTYAMARHADTVVGVDASPTMLRRAGESAFTAETARIQWLELSAFLNKPAKFDLVHSSLVFQHIPVSAGLSLMRVLANSVNHDGHLVIHFPYWRGGGAVRRLARRLRSTVPGVNVMANLVSGKKPSTPYMQMNVYDVGEVLDVVFVSGLEAVTLVPENDRDIRGVLLIARRR